MGEGEKNTEYKRSRLSSSDRGIRIIGTTKEEYLNFTRSLFEKNFTRLFIRSRIEKLKSKRKYRKTKGKKWDKEVRIVSTMEDLEYMEKLLSEEFRVVSISDIYKLTYPDNLFARYFRIRDKKKKEK